VIRSLADSVRADVIVLGRHRDASAHAPLGSTTMRVVTSSWAPCLILSDSMTLPLERVLAPIDLADASRGTLVVALSWASALRGAARLGASRTDEPVRLTALHVARSLDEGATGQRRTLDEMLDRLRADAGGWAGVTIAGVVAEGRDASSTIADYTREHDVQLLVLGTRGLGTGAVGRLGSVSLGVAQRVTTPVLLVPPALWSADSARP
jgi:nucleotide-binding universal stress UspA family protein